MPGLFALDDFDVLEGTPAQFAVFEDETEIPNFFDWGNDNSGNDGLFGENGNLSV
jgi:hypothetical protein